MRKILPITLILAVCFFITLPCGAEVVTVSISSDEAAGTFTTTIRMPNRFNVSISGTWAGTVYLQRSFDTGTTWLDVDSFTTNIETTVDDPQTGGPYYRIGMKNGGYTSGTVVLRLTK